MMKASLFSEQSKNFEKLDDAKKLQFLEMLAVQWDPQGKQFFTAQIMKVQKDEIQLQIWQKLINENQASLVQALRNTYAEFDFLQDLSLLQKLVSSLNRAASAPANKVNSSVLFSMMSSTINEDVFTETFSAKFIYYTNKKPELDRFLLVTWFLVGYQGLTKLTKPLTLDLREKSAEFLALQATHSDGRTEVEREKLKEMLRLVL